MKEQARVRSRSRRRGRGRAYDDAPVGLALISSEGRFLQVNPKLCTILGYTRRQLLRTTLGAVTDPHDQALMESNSRRLLAGEVDEIQLEQHFLHADGRQFPGRFSASVATGVGVRSFACVLEIDGPGEHSPSRTQGPGGEAHPILDDFFDGVVAIDEHGRIASFNQAARRLFGYDAAEILGREAGRIIAGPCQDEFADYLLAGWARSGRNAAAPAGPREMWGRRKDGSTFPIEIRGTRMLLDGAQHLVAILRDISEQKARTEALEYRTLHDVLTNLPNRVLLSDRLHQAILTGSRQGRTAALLIMDVDGFKEVNDTHGHHVGDRLLQQIALRLEGLLRSSDTVARLGGDEFAILPGLGMGGEDGARTAQKVLRVLEQPFWIDDRVVRIAASIGIALFPAHGRDAPSLMRHADEAMYVAKRAQSGYAFYVPRHEGVPEHRVPAGELGYAIAHDQLVLHFQPTIDLRIGRTIGVEALVRWQHPEQGLMLPKSFIPAAEEAGLIMPLTRWVLNRALQQTRTWLQAGLAIDVAVNLSALSLLDSGLPAMTRGLLESWRVDPGRLKADLPESSVLAAPAIETATQLGALGIGLAVDDFGAGAASLAHLARLPVREVKIDGSIAAKLVEGDDGVLRPMVELGHSMGLRMAAKRVEDQETLDRLLDVGCDSAQGFHLCPPIVAADLAPWLRDSAWGPVESFRAG